MLNNVQALRALAAMLVVLGHLQPLFETVHPALAWVGLGRCGVDLFFVISGFIMVHTTRAGDTSPGAFAIRRLVRILPLYWAVTLAVFAVALVAPSLVQASRPDPVWLAKSLAFIPFDKGDGTTNPLLPVGWSLNYEMFFYAVFALCLFIRHETARYVAAAVLIGLLSAPGFAGVHFAGVAAEFYTRPIALEFALGVVLGLAYPAFRPLATPALRVAAGAGLGFAVAALIASGVATHEPLRVAIAAPAGVAAVALALALERSGRSVENAAVLRTGDASYAIYLTHLFLTQAFVHAAGALGVRTAAGSLLMILAALAAVVLAGWVVFAGFERPMARWIRRTFGIAPAPTGFAATAGPAS